MLQHLSTTLGVHRWSDDLPDWHNTEAKPYADDAVLAALMPSKNRRRRITGVREQESTTIVAPPQPLSIQPPPPPSVNANERAGSS
ncbi:hypothetical protein BYT27DRAFT_7253813 [Phlegmacium glaucopus]|nr:hypothetical protein BYT27DRAFT_7253813 [Phlegmacium glaucopus]